MTNTAAPIQGTAPISTTLDVGAAAGAVGAGAPPPEVKEEAKPQPTPADALREELASLRAKDADEAAKVKEKADAAVTGAKAKAEEAKEGEKSPEKAETEKPQAEDKDKDKAKAEEPAPKAEKSAAEKPAAGQEGEGQRQSEGRKHSEPPARFMPKAKEAWVNVPHSVRDDVIRMEQEHAQEIETHRKTSERYESLREYDEIAKKNGRDLKDSLAKIVQIEGALAKNPVVGLDMILREIGPRKADGSPVSLYELAHHIAKQSPQQFQQTQSAALAQQQAQNTQSEAKRLADENERLRIQMAAQPVIAQFAATHPRYQELEGAIAGFLKSGLIPASLSPEQKLAAAYDMAERISPRSVSPALQEVPEAPADAKPAPADEAGRKSIRGAPTGGEDPGDDAADATDLRELLRKEARKLAS